MTENKEDEVTVNVPSTEGLVSSSVRSEASVGSSVPLQGGIEWGESSTSVLPHKKRNWNSAAIYEDEKMIPLKKRRSFLSTFNQEEAMQEGEEAEAVEDKHEYTNDMAIQHIIAASWDSSFENQEPSTKAYAVEEAPMEDSPMPIVVYRDEGVGHEGEAAVTCELKETAMVLHDGASGTEGETLGTDETAILVYDGKSEGRDEVMETALVVYDLREQVAMPRPQRLLIVGRTDVLNRSLAIVETERKQSSVTKPRSRIPRRPRAYYAPFLTTGDFSAELAVPLDFSAELAVPLPLLLTEGDDENDDLYPRVKRRRGRRSRSLMDSATTSSGQGSQCSRVNGRGWRCKEVPDFGYSLCKHHLGKRPKGNLGSTPGPKKKSGRKPKLGSTAELKKNPGRKRTGKEEKMQSTAAGPKKRGRKKEVVEGKTSAGKSAMKTLSIKGGEEKMSTGRLMKTRSMKSILKN